MQNLTKQKTILFTFTWDLFQVADNENLLLTIILSNHTQGNLQLHI